MVAGSRTRSSFCLLERSSPDRARVERGLELLGRMLAQAYARDRTLVEADGSHDPRWIPLKEERRDAADN